MKPLLQLQADNGTRQREADSLSAVVGELQEKEILGGVLLHSVSLVSSGTTKVAHRLGRRPRGFIVCDRNADSSVWRTASDDKFLSLNCSANVMVSLWVF